MPQLDTSTYIGQVTWFSVIFSIFYIIVLTDVLPGLNRAIKIRAKKLDRTRDDAREFDTERSTAENNYARSTSSSSVSSYLLLISTQDTQSKWLSTNSWSISNTQPKSSGANSTYIDALVQSDASVSVLSSTMNQVALTDADFMTDAKGNARSNPEIFE